MSSAIEKIDFTQNPYGVICDLKDLVYRLEKENGELKSNNSDRKARYQTMTKQELIENYTMEQLADKIVALEILISDNKNTAEILKREHEKIICDKEDEIKELKSQLHRKETEINQIDEILEKLFGVTHDVVSEPDEFERILTEKTDGYKAISDFLPEKPIEVASVLINAERECEPLKLFGNTYTDTYKLFGISELRQIAEHLLIYCNTNESEGEE